MLPCTCTSPGPRIEARSSVLSGTILSLSAKFLLHIQRDVRRDKPLGRFDACCCGVECWAGARPTLRTLHTVSAGHGVPRLAPSSASLASTSSHWLVCLCCVCGGRVKLQGRCAMLPYGASQMTTQFPAFDLVLLTPQQIGAKSYASGLAQASHDAEVQGPFWESCRWRRICRSNWPHE
jgi:hypothetical protein